MERIGALQRAGRFRAFGVSCDKPEVALAAAGVESVQVTQFTFEDKPEDRALLSTLASRGKTAVVRGLVAGAAPAVGGIIVGTTNVAHLRENVAALARAMDGETTDAAPH